MKSPVNVIVQAFRHIAGGGRRRKRSKHSKTSDSMSAVTAAEVAAAAPSPVMLMNGCNGNHYPKSLTPASSATAEDGDDEGEEGREEEKVDNSDSEEEGEEDPIKSKETGAWQRWADACELSRVGRSVSSDYGGYSSTSPKGMMRTRQGAFLSFGPGRGVMSGQGWNHLRERALATQATSWEDAVNSFTPPSMYQLRYHLKASGP